MKVFNLDFGYNDFVVLRNINFSLNKNEFISILGRSGCGKTTLLKIISGRLKPKKGKILFEGDEILSPSSKISYMSQEYDLFPWMTIYQNILFGIKYKERNIAIQKEKTIKLIKELNLFDFKDYYPSQISGGMKQRVALARALNAQSQVFLLDEPFNSIDVYSKRITTDILEKVFLDYKRSFIMVTHNIDDAIFLSDRIIILGNDETTIVKEYKIDLPRPRNENVRFSDELNQIKKEIISNLY